MSIKGSPGVGKESPSGAEVTLGNKLENHQMYKKLGGFLYKEDYKTVLSQAREISRRGNSGSAGTVDVRSQVTSMTKMAGIGLPVNHRDPRLIVYQALVEMLRTNPKPGLTMRYKHINKDRNEILFAESLRILGQSEQLDKLKSRYSHIRN